LFNLQHNTGRTVIQYRMHQIVYQDQDTAMSHEMERLWHENAILRRRTLLTSDQDREL
jgi:hypothetical protein